MFQGRRSTIWQVEGSRAGWRLILAAVVALKSYILGLTCPLRPTQIYTSQTAASDLNRPNGNKARAEKVSKNIYYLPIACHETKNARKVTEEDKNSWKVHQAIYEKK